MRIFPLVCLALTIGLAQGQDTPVAPPAASQQPGRAGDEDEKETLPVSAAGIAPDAAVLTIKGLCAKPENTAGPGPADATCQTVVTRAEFERLSADVHANAAVQKRQLATTYSRLLAMSRAAERRGLDKQAEFQERIAFSRLQILSQELVRSVREEAAKVPQNDIEDYYRNNSAAFERATLERISVPDIRQAEASNNNKGASAGTARSQQEEQDKAAMRQEAERLRARAAAGEDFASLQKKAYEFARLNTPAPPTSLEKMPRAGLPPAHQSVFDLKTGDVSQVIGDPGGFYIYKLVAKEIEPMSQAEGEIRKKLADQRMRSMMQQIQDSVTTDMNQAYFGTAADKRHAPSAKGKTPAENPPANPAPN